MKQWLKASLIFALFLAVYGTLIMLTLHIGPIAGK